MIPRTIRLNDSIVALIEKEVSKRFKKNSREKQKNYNPYIKIKSNQNNKQKSETDVDKEAKEVGTDHDF